mmetsp:Transcript_26683/g.70044  ORF Transcript_26683/g.70044 Transcript_26683/m.70044 type:complete len:164 (+) Transcript_26683:830-1321(+)
MGQSHHQRSQRPTRSRTLIRAVVLHPVPKVSLEVPQQTAREREEAREMGCKWVGKEKALGHRTRGHLLQVVGLRTEVEHLAPKGGNKTVDFLALACREKVLGRKVSEGSLAGVVNSIAEVSQAKAKEHKAVALNKCSLGRVLQANSAKAINPPCMVQVDRPWA